MLVHAGCWHRPRTDGFVFFKEEDTGGGPGLVEKGAVASWAAPFRSGFGWGRRARVSRCAEARARPRSAIQLQTIALLVESPPFPHAPVWL